MRQVILSVTIKDCEVYYSRGHGPGGQKINKTNIAVRVVHPPSGAVGECKETRSQHENRSRAFKKMAETPRFQSWAKMESYRKIGLADEIERRVEKQMNPKNIVVEVQEDGKWTRETIDLS